MTVPRAIAFIKAKRPGKFAIANPGFEIHRVYLVVEVDEYGFVHQLNQQGERDGVLNDDAWTRDDVQAYYVNEDKTLFIRIA